MIHESLKSLGSVTETKGHGDKFKKAKWSNDGCFWNVSRIEGNLVIAFYQIKFGKDFCTMEGRRKILEVGEGVTVRNSGHVKAAVVAAGAPRTIWFRNHVERRRPWTGGPANDTSFFKLGEFCFGCLETVGIKTAGLGENRWAGGLNEMLDTVVGAGRMEISIENSRKSRNELTKLRGGMLEGGHVGREKRGGSS